MTTLLKLCLTLSLVRMHSAAASMWALTGFSYSSVGENASDISWRVSNLFLCVIVYLLLISHLSNRDQSECSVLVVCVVFLRRLRRTFAVIILWSMDRPSKEEPASQFKARLIYFFFIRMWYTCTLALFEKVLIVPHFFLTSCESRICCFRIKLFEHSCLQQGLEGCVSGWYWLGRIARGRRWLGCFITGIGMTVVRKFHRRH